VVLRRGKARERVDLLLGAALRGQHLDALGRRRLDRQEAVALEVAADEIDERVELQLVLRQELLVEALQQGRAYFSHGMRVRRPWRRTSRGRSFRRSPGTLRRCARP